MNAILLRRGAAGLGVMAAASVVFMIPDSTGVTVNEATTPFLVQLMRESNGRVKCGGIALSNQWVLTAGHCVDPEGSVCTPQFPCVARPAGTNQHFSFTVTLPPPPGFNARPGSDATNDLGLLRLISHNGAAPLAAPWSAARIGRVDTVPTPGSFVAYGWGIPQVLDLPELRRTRALSRTAEVDAACRALFGPTQQIQADELCVGGEELAPCAGDSGGPLIVATVAGNPAAPPVLGNLVGIVSQADAGCDNPDAAIFSAFDASDFQWIESTTGIDIP